MYRTKENALIRNKSQRNLIRNKSQRANIYRQGQSGAPNESLWSANPCSKFEDKFLLHMLQSNGFPNKGRCNGKTETKKPTA